MQTYVWPHSVAALVMTRTELAVTPPAVVAAMSDGHLVAFPKAVLDARRRIPNSDDNEPPNPEVAPYAAVLPLQPTMFLNYNRTVWVEFGGVAVGIVRASLSWGLLPMLIFALRFRACTTC